MTRVHSLGPGATLIAVVVLIWVVARQVQARPLAVKSGFAVPAVIALLGLLLLLRGARSGQGLTSADMAWVGADLGLAVITGVIRAPAVRIFARDGTLWRQGGPLTVALWLASIGARLGIGALAAHQGAGAGVADSVLLSFGVTLAAQYAVLGLRARRVLARAGGAPEAAGPPQAAVREGGRPSRR